VLEVPADDGFFDKVICLNVFPHFADRAAALAEFARLLRDGGDLWINHFANRDAINEFHHGCDPAVRDHLIPPDDEVRRLLEEAGFEVVSHDDDDPGYRWHARRR
jgi:ubiquinone/menaquinone biosynthesis C-methylase UbiE